MLVKLLMIFSFFVVSAPSLAFTCFFTLAKDSCWTNYDVTVNVIDASTSKSVVKIAVPKGTAWGRVKFNCTPAQQFLYKATYQPVFWQSEIGKIYSSKRYWSLPGAIGKNETAWNIPVCFPSDFSEIPLPPTATGNCKCDLTKIPAPPPQ